MKTLEETIKELEESTSNPIEERILEVFIGQRCAFDPQGLDPDVIRDYRREQYEVIGKDYDMQPNSVAQIGVHYDLKFKKATDIYSCEDWNDFMNSTDNTN